MRISAGQNLRANRAKMGRTRQISSEFVLQKTLWGKFTWWRSLQRTKENMAEVEENKTRLLLCS